MQDTCFQSKQILPQLLRELGLNREVIHQSMAIPATSPTPKPIAVPAGPANDPPPAPAAAPLAVAPPAWRLLRSPRPPSFPPRGRSSTPRSHLPLHSIPNSPIPDTRCLRLGRRIALQSFYDLLFKIKILGITTSGRSLVETDALTCESNRARSPSSPRATSAWLRSYLDLDPLR